MIQLQETTLSNCFFVKGFDSHNAVDLSSSKSGKTFSDWNDWTPLREDYGSEESLYKDVDIFDDTRGDFILDQKEKVVKDKKLAEDVKLNYDNENDVLPTSKLPKTLPYGE